MGEKRMMAYEEPMATRRNGGKRTHLGEDVVVEDVVEGGDEDDAREEVRVGGEEVLEEEGDAHLEEGFEVRGFFLCVCVCVCVYVCYVSG